MENEMKKPRVKYDDFPVWDSTRLYCDTIVAHDDTTVAVVHYTDVDGTFQATGTAKRMDEDKFDPELGKKLATARALQQLGKELEREAYQTVHYRDWVRETQREASEKAVARKKANTYKFQCEFAALINAKIAEEEPLEENDVTPNQWWKSTGSVVNGFDSPVVIRADLPA